MGIWHSGILLFVALSATPQERAQQLITSEEVVWIGSGATDGGAGSAGAGAAVPVLVETMQAEDEQARLRALEAMAKLNPQANPDVFFQALGDPSSAVRETAARVVSGFDGRFVFDRVMDMLTGPAGANDEAVALSLPLLRGVLETPMLDVLQSSAGAADSAAGAADSSAGAGLPEDTVERRAAAAYSLGLMGSAQAVPALAQLAWGGDEWLAAVCTQALLNIHDPVVTPKLAELTAHPAEQIRWAAVEGLGALGGPEAIDALGRVAVTRPADDKELSRRAVQLLADTNDPAVIPILIQAMDRNLAVRRMTVDALAKITGQDLGDMPSLWIEWWQKRNDPSQPQQMPEQRPLFDVEYMDATQ